MANERKIVELVIDASGVEAGERRAALAFDHLGDRAAAAQAKATASIQQSMRVYESQLPQSIDRTAAAYDRLRAKTDPVLAAQLKLESEMTRSLQTINQAVLKGVATQQQAEQEVMKLRNQQIRQLEDVRRAHERVNEAQVGNAANDNRRQNLGYQLLDIGQSAAGGMSPAMIAAQQGPQILQLYAGQGGVKSALSDVATIAGSAVGAIGALPLALGAAGAAAIVYAKSSEVSLKNVDEQLTKHRANVKALGDAYGIAEQKAKSYSEADRAVSRAATLGSLDEQEKLQVQAARELRLQFGSMQTPGKGGQAYYNLFPDYKPFAAAFSTLDSGIRNGRIEGEKFIETVSGISKINPQYEEFGNKILKAAQQFLQINTEITKTKYLLTQIGNLPRLDPLGTFSPINDAQRAAERTPSLFQQQQNRIDALRQQTAARSPAEKEAAARAAASAQFNASESSTDRDNRIDLAGMQARIAAEHSLSEAQRDRARSLQQTMDAQQLEASLIGKTASEAVALRMEFELTSQLREEAARNAIAIDQREIETIKQKSAQFGRLAEQIAKTNLRRDLQLERDQLFRSPVDQQIAARQQAAGLAVDLTSDEADMIRQNLRASSLKEGIQTFLTDFRQALVSNGGNVGKAFGETVLNSIVNALTKAGDEAFSRLANSIVAAFFPATGGAGSAGVSAASKILGAANDNVSGIAKVGAVTRSALPDIPIAGDVASLIAKVAPKYGVDTATALAVAKSEGGLSSWNLQSNFVKNGIREQSFGPFQLYKGGGLGNRFMSETGLDPALAANGPAATEWAIKYASKNGWGSWYGAGKAGIGNWDGIGGNSSAADAVNKLAESAGAATKGLDTLGGGLGKIGQSLSTSFFPAAPAASGGGGGLSSWLGGLFGGFKPVGAQANLAASGKIFGLFDRGGFTGHGGVNDPAGIVHRGEVVWSQSDVARAGGVGIVEGMRLGYRGYAGGGAAGMNVVPIRPAANASGDGRMKVDVGVTVENGELKGFVRSIVREDTPGIAEQVGNQQRQDDQIAAARGRFGTTQQQFMKRKG